MLAGEGPVGRGSFLIGLPVAPGLEPPAVGQTLTAHPADDFFENPTETRAEGAWGLPLRVDFVGKPTPVAGKAEAISRRRGRPETMGFGARAGAVIRTPPSCRPLESCFARAKPG